MEMSLSEKHDELKRRLADMGSALVAFSGGVDSSLLLNVAREALGSDVVAATVFSPIHPKDELERAERIAQVLGVEHLSLSAHELEDPVFVSNPPERCYYCKHTRFLQMVDIATREGISEVIDGTHLDDLEEYRPGLQAATELGVRSPLAECGLSKYDVRALSRSLGLSNWNYPPTTCLATRIPYGEEITPWKLTIVEEGEKFLRELGLYDVRLRFMGENAARIEVSPYCLPTLVSEGVRTRVITFLKKMGFTYATIDLEGYRSGSMDEGRG